MRAVGPVRLAQSALVACIVGCVHNVAPKVTPSKVPAVRPSIRSLGVLIITPSFENYTSQTSEGIHTFRYRMGASATGALERLVYNSFDHASVQRVGDAEVLALFAAPPDTSSTSKVLLVPYFATGAAKQSLFTVSADVQLRLDVKACRGGATYSWIGQGHTTRAVSSRGGLTGSALEQALVALSDSLAAHRSELESPATGGTATGP